jgi:chaperonin GroES
MEDYSEELEPQEEIEEEFNGEEEAFFLDKMLAFLDSDNIAEILDDTQLNNLGANVIDETKIDEDSRKEWIERTDRAMDMAMQIIETKSTPWPNASNIKFPLISEAAIQFNAHAYPAIVGDNGVVKTKTVGDDPDGQKGQRAERVREHMNYQLTEEMEEWEPELDRQLIVLPIVGCDFKKTYYCDELGRNVSARVSAKDVIVNHGAKSLETAPRVSMRFTLYPYEVEEKKRAGVYLDKPLQDSGDEASDSTDEQAPMKFIEQQRREDLDGDGYQEPYTVTVHEDSGIVVRIEPAFNSKDVKLKMDGATATLDQVIANYTNDAGLPEDVKVQSIKPEMLYTKYSFIPNPDGGFYDIGLGYLMEHIGGSIDTILNQLIDAGTLQNRGGGFIGRGAKLKRGSTKFRIGEYVPVEVNGRTLRENLVPAPVAGPSQTLFALLGTLIDAAKGLSSVNNAMTGDLQANVQPTTLITLVEQGQRVFNAVYKRIHRSLKEELKKLYILNSEHLTQEAYQNVTDVQSAVKSDYAEYDCDVVPMSDPTAVTDAQKLARAQFLMQFRGDPQINQQEILQRVFTAARIHDLETLIVPPQGQDMAMLAEMARMELQKAKLDNETKKANASMITAITNGVKSLEQAESENAGRQIDMYKRQLTEFINTMRIENEREINPGGMGGMEQPPSNQGIQEVPPAIIGGSQGSMV